MGFKLAARVAFHLTVAFVCLGFSIGCQPKKTAPAEHVVLVVWDGLRPDLVTEKNTPTLWQLARDGVTFRNHHSAYPSATNVNGTIMATGVFPARSGVIANMEFRRQADALKPVDMADAARIREGDEQSGGKYLAVSTIPELLHASGKSTAIAGTKWVAALFDRAPSRVSIAAQNSPRVTAGAAQPAAVERALHDSLGAFPRKQMPNTAQDIWTTRALTEFFWKESVPAFSLLWLSDPDFTQHDSAPGAPVALAGLRSSDACLGKVIAALGAKHVSQQTDMMVVSDHGFSTVERAIDVPALLQADGFKAAKKFAGEPEPASILVVGNGGTVLFYVTGRDEAVTTGLVEWLQQSDFAGVIFTRARMEGAFGLQEVHLEKEEGPDVVMAFRWNEQSNEFGVSGLITADWNRSAGRGMHATLSRFDLHNTLIASGPHFRRGFQSDLPSGNIDLGATILHLLGVAPSMPLDGRVLSEALSHGPGKSPAIKTEMLEVSRDFATTTWRQHLKTSSVGAHRYIDEGNGAARPKE